MNDTNHMSRPRCLVVWLGVSAVVAAVLWALLPLEVSLDGSFEVLLVRLCSWALAACGLWFWIVSTVVVVDALLTPRGAQPRVVPGVPAPVGRLVLLLCGVAISGGIAAPALATPGPVHLGGQDHSGRISISGLPFPDRATTGSTPHAGAKPHAQPHAQSHRHSPAPAQLRRGDRQVVVGPGDSLWSIAESHLPATAGNTEVATAWHAIFALNRDVIGPDPDRVEPGQLLDLPAHLGSRSEGASS